MSANLARILTETAERNGDQTAFKLDDVELNYSMLEEGSARVAGLLKSKGLEPGDRVGLMMPNVPYFPVIYYGILRAGGVVVPMNVLLKGREVAFYLEDPEAKIVFAWGDFAEAAEEGAEKAGTANAAASDKVMSGRMFKRSPSGRQGRAPTIRRWHRPALGGQAWPR